MSDQIRFNKIVKILGDSRLSITTNNINMFDKLTSTELDDEIEISKIVSEIKKYELYQENNKNKYPEYIMKCVRQAMGYKEFDFTHDEEINNFSHDKILKYVCQWNNLINFSDSIKTWIQDIYKIDLK